MKKFVSFLLCLILCSSAIFSSEDEVNAANKKTAERCLKLAESSVIKKEWKSAYNHAEMGLSYDDSVSDLYYIKAVALNNLGEKRAEILKTIQTGFDKNNWLKDNKNSSRILFADLLSETGDYIKSLDVLNQDPLIYSADAEFIRVKNYYRIGTSQYINMARQKIDSLVKLFPKDERFPRLFFMFETLFMTKTERNGMVYQIPEDVKKIANKYIKKFPDYKNKDVSLEVMASLFAEGETQTRLIKAIGEKDSKSDLYAYAALKNGVISEEKAFNLFFGNTEIFSLDLFEAFASLITDQALLVSLKEQLDSFSKIIVVDDNLDLINELVVYYDRGRPVSIKYDKNNDEVLDIFASCDFGVPLTISFGNEKTDLFYDLYPYVNKISDNNLNADYYFGTDEYMYSPFDMIVNTTFQKIGSEFYVPYINPESTCPDRYTLMKKASSINVKTYEREGSWVKYLILNGIPHSIYFYQSNVEDENYYAFAMISEGFPFVRYVDYDNDSIFETLETYDLDFDNLFVTQEDKDILRKIFGDLPLNEKIYLSKVEIDRNSDTLPEFREWYIGNGGKMCSWDNDENGIWDYEYILYSKEEGKPQIQDTIFYDSNGIEIVTVRDVDGEPSIITKSNKELQVFAGYSENYYWIEKKCSEKIEKAIKKEVGSELNIGVVRLVVVDGIRYNVIKVGKNIYCHELPSSDFVLQVLTEEN